MSTVWLNIEILHISRNIFKVAKSESDLEYRSIILKLSALENVPLASYTQSVYNRSCFLFSYVNNIDKLNGQYSANRENTKLHNMDFPYCLVRICKQIDIHNMWKVP